MDELTPSQRMILWLNETYHLFSIDKNDVYRLPRSSPFVEALGAGAYVFSGEKTAFMVSKDNRFLTLCPKLENRKVEMTARELSGETLRFMQDFKVQKFFSCESILLAR
jgi:hypothetical protein